MRVLVTGAGGLVGGRLSALLQSSFSVTAAWHRAPPPLGLSAVALDLLAPSSMAAALDEARPDAVVHAVALGVDDCESQPEAAEALHVRGAEALARECRRRRVRLLALSTDLVLGGGRAYSQEGDAASPLQAYGRTKLRGEEAVLGADPGSAVLRLALVHGRGHGSRGSATESIAWALRSHQPLALFTDQYRTPVDIESIAALVTAVLRGAGHGRYHVGGPERISRYELGLRVASVLGLPPGSIRPVTREQHPLPAPRPLDTSLDCGRARRELGWAPRPLNLGIREGRAEPG